MTPEGRTPLWGASLSWQSFNVLLQVVLQLVYIRILAGLLAPEDFGVMALALIVVGVVEIFAQVGIGPSIVQFPQLTPQHVSSAWWFSALLGLLFFAAMYLAAPEFAHHYDTPVLQPVLRWISLSFVISGFSVVSRSLLVRDMNFKALTQCALTGMVLGNLVVGLGLAFAGAGIWAYVAALLVQNLVLSAGYIWLARIPVSQGCQPQALSSLLGYGTRSTAFNLLTYTASKVDLWWVGESLGTRATGMYDRAVHLMGQPITVLGKLGDSVLFSGLSSLQNNLPEMQRVVLRGMHLIALATLPLTVALVWQAEGVTWLFLGPQFKESAPIVQVLFAAVAFRALTKLGDANMRALDGLTAGIAIKVVFLAAIAGGVWWNLDHGHGAVGAAKAVVLASVLQWLLTVGWMSVRLKLRLLPLLRALQGGLILSVVVVAPMALLAWTWWAESALSAGLAMAILVWFPALSLPQALDQQGDLRRQVAAKLPNSSLRRRWMH